MKWLQPMRSSRRPNTPKNKNSEPLILPRQSSQRKLNRLKKRAEYEKRIRNRENV